MKNSKLLTKILIILVIIVVTLIAFLGIYVKDKNTTKNLIKENVYGMNLKGYRLVSLNPSTKTEKIYYNSEGTKVESSEATNDDGNLKEGYVEKEENVNKPEVLTAENFEKMQKIIENRLKRLGITQYNIKLDKWTGQIVVEMLEDEDIDDTITYLNNMGQFAIIDAETKEVLINSDRVKSVKVMYSEQQIGTSVFLNIELDKEGKEKLKEITSTYVANKTETTEEGETNTDTETKEKQITMQVENQDLFSTAFEREITDGIMSITLGTATTNEAFSEYIDQANIMATIIGSGETNIQYSISENLAVSATISEQLIRNILMVTAVIIAIALIIWAIKYKINGIYAIISYIGAISILNLLIKYANVVISLETIVAIYAILIANYIFISILLRKIKEDKEINDAFIETALEKLNIILPITIIAVVFTFMGWLPVFSIGMTLFWGIITLAITNYLFTRKLLVSKDIKE